ncbi:hypothetical protein MGWOODY_Clf2538 [hydrothermal vent metagenome]|uniref:Uncharacterized protein n=1 Tax=hydrothermal vent metagenome TaxID=652676 RepID=A0A170Q9G8_9ZZZZ
MEAAQTSRNRPAQKENGSSLTWLFALGIRVAHWLTTKAH